MYHFLWVTFLYLIPFYFLISLFFIPYLLKYFPNWLLFLLIISFFFYNTEVLDFTVINFQIIGTNNLFLQFNTLLTNNLNKTHPFIFYLGTLYLFNNFISNFFLPYFPNKFKNLYIISNYHRSLSTYLTITSLSLFLGSWWAIQEGTWGGWWNWDPSETFGLLFLLFFLYLTHKSLYSSIVTKLNSSTLLIVFWILLSYFFIQLNFDLVSHNFGVKFFYFFNNKLFFYQIILYLLYNLLIFYKSLNKVNKFKQSLYLSNLPTNQLFWFSLLLKFVITALIFFSVFISFFILLNFFIWNFLLINFFNSEVQHYVANLFFILFILYFLITKNFYHLFTVIFTSFFLTNFYSLILLQSFSLKTKVKLIHTSLIIFFIVNLLTYYTNFILWSLYTPLESFFLQGFLIESSLFSYSCDYMFIEKTDLYKSVLDNWFTSWNFYLYSNTPIGNTFLLLFSNNDFNNFYKLFSFMETSYIFIENHYSPYLSTIFLILIIYLLKSIFFSFYNKFY